MRITMIGHSTVLIETEGTRLITDPYFGKLGNVAYRRVGRPALEREEVPEVDAVLVSHGHWDHTDRRFFRALAPSIPVLAPAGASVVLKVKGARNIMPLRPWQAHPIGAALVTAVPAVHLARAVGYVIESGGFCAYFAGDTYHRPFMREIGRRFAITVALLPVATFRIPPTMGERGAVAAVRDIRPATVIPIHLGLQPRSFLLRTSENAAGFERRLRTAGLDAQVVQLREGGTWESPAARAGASSGPRGEDEERSLPQLD